MIFSYLSDLVVVTPVNCYAVRYFFPLQVFLWCITQRRDILTFSICDAVGRDGSTYMDHATAIWHFIFTGVFTGVVVVDGMDDTQIQNQTVQNLEKDTQQINDYI